jgi:hypothetical protein
MEVLYVNPEVDWKKISSFEQSGEPVMKQEPGAKSTWNV